MEINKCLEDPNTVYSDQYMPLALMPAVIEAIQNAGGGIEIITATFSETAGGLVLSKTWNELNSMLSNSVMPFVLLNTIRGQMYLPVKTMNTDEESEWSAIFDEDNAVFTASSADGDLVMSLN